VQILVQRPKQDTGHAGSGNFPAIIKTLKYCPHVWNTVFVGQRKN